MIKKIISGGQTGAQRAALDFVIKFAIPYGGSIPKSRLTEDGCLSKRHKLQEMATESYKACTEQNIIDSHGTVIFSRGQPSGETAYTLKLAKRHKKHWRHADLNLETSFDAASLISSWIQLGIIWVLNVAGPRSSEDPDIYQDVCGCCWMQLRVCKLETFNLSKKLPR
jgi:hypothetical protein